MSEAAARANAPAVLPARVASDEDRAALRPVYAVWELTLACDQHCGHCGSRAGRKRPRELTTAECLEVVAALARLGTREVTLIGGEAYLRRDWLAIVRAVSDAGMVCTMQTGGRNFGAADALAAREAGLRSLGVSIDGLADVHDALRGVRGSYDAALRAVGHARAAGLVPTVNTQLSPPTVAQLPALMERLVEAGASAWRVGMIGAMGAAADRPELLLQPYDLLEVMPLLARLADAALPRGLDLQLDNGLGYFGPHEERLRGAARGALHWSGCAAGVNVIGIESDGTVKGCPSLPTAPYAGGRVTERGLEELWRTSPEIGFARAPAGGPAPSAAREALRGFCASCYYADVCRAGCTWQSHVLLGAAGENPYCHHRALELRRQGLRERVERVEAAGGAPYDFGRFELRRERTDGSALPAGADGPVDGTRARDPDRRWEATWRREALETCPACSRHVFPGTGACPHCGSDVAAERRQADAAQRERLQAVDAARERLRGAVAALARALPEGG